MVQQGIFRAPYALTRGLYSGGGNQDPIAALVGNALGTYQAGREKDIYDALQAKKEQDEADWRQYQVGAQAAEKGLTATAPAGTPIVPNLPMAPYSPSMTPSGTGPGALTVPSSPALQRPDLSAATTMKPPTPVVPGVGKYPALYRDFQAPAKPEEYEFIHEPGGPVLRAGKHSGVVEPTGQTLPPTKTPGFHVEWADDGSGSGRQVAKYVPDAPPTAGTPPPAVPIPGLTREGGAKPTPKQGETAEFGAGALAAWQHVEKERTQHPNVETEVGKIMASPAFVHAVPGFRQSSDMVQLLQKAGASPEAVRYMRAKWSFLDNVIRTRIPGGRMSGPLFAQVQNEFMPSLDPAGNPQIRNNEVQAILTAQGESGYDVNPEVWNRAVKRHGVSGIDLQNVLAGGSGYNPKHTDYPPGFVPK